MPAVPVVSELHVLAARGSGDQAEPDQSQVKTHHPPHCALCTDGLTFSFSVKEEEVDEEKIIPKTTEFSEGVGCYRICFSLTRVGQSLEREVRLAYVWWDQGLGASRS